MIKHISLLLIVIMFCSCLSTKYDSRAKSEVKHVFLLIGQSNIVGRAKLLPGEDQVIPRAQLWNGVDWEPAKAPLNRYSKHKKTKSIQGMNCGPSFIKAYQEANPGVEVGIICWARGGSKIEEWHPDKFKRYDLYNEAVKQTHAALEQGGELNGILWHQGEANSKNVADYPKLLKAHVAHLREEFNKPELPFVFGQIGQWREDFKAFNKMITQQVYEIPFSACVRSDGLTNFDAWHFDHSSQVILGNRYADKLAEITANFNKK